MRGRCPFGATACTSTSGVRSTRPGSARVSAEEQIRRGARLIGEVKRALDTRGLRVPISVDTTLAPVAESALDAGAEIVNDVSAGRDDPGMFALANPNRNRAMGRSPVAGLGPASDLGRIPECFLARSRRS